MLLGFRKFHPVTKENTYFREKILSFEDPSYVAMGFIYPKIQTLRSENNRIEPGTNLHMAYGVRTKDYYQFNKDYPLLSKCKSTQKVDIIVEFEVDEANDLRIPVGIPTKDKNDPWPEYYVSLGITVDGKELDVDWITKFIRNDGFESAQDFLLWFDVKTTKNLKLIHWTNFKY